jgi:hypothetical protein
MDLVVVHTQLNLALATTGLRTVPWGIDQVIPPAALHAFPESVELRSLGAGPAAPWQMTGWKIAVVTGPSGDRSAAKDLSAYVRGSGTKSVVRALEDYAGYTAIDNVTVNAITFDFPEHAGTPYLAAIFDCTINGSAT